MNRADVLAMYREMTLKDLLEMRFNGSFVPGAIEYVIFEKVEELEEERCSAVYCPDKC